MSIYPLAKAVVPPVIGGLYHLKTEGAENIPADGPVIVCSNHRSNLDPLLLGIAFLKRRLHFMAKIELFRVPVLRSVIRSLGAFPVRRGQGDAGAMAFAADILRKGGALLMFPEGTRQKYMKDLLRFKSGAARLALQTKAPVLPVAVVPAGKRVGMLRRTVVRIGKPIPFEELGFENDQGSVEAFHRASSVIRNRVAALLAEDAPHE